MTMVYSSVGKSRLRVFGALYVVNIIVLALSTRVNQFMDFFYMADIFPFVLSTVTLVLLSIVLISDFTLQNPITSRPPFEIGLLTLLTVFWLAFNAFSTSRWRFVPLACGDIPAEFSDERAWCHDLQALKVFVWINWVILLFTAIFTVRYTIVQHVRGNKEIWRTALSHYAPRSDGGMHRRNTSFFSGFGSHDFSTVDSRGGRAL